MKIAMDIDGVVSDTSKMLKKVAKDFGYILTFNSYNSAVAGISDLEAFYDKIVKEAFSNRMEQILPYEDAVPTISLIRRHIGTLTFVTARHTEHRQLTLDWLNRYFDIPFELVNVPSTEKVQFILSDGFGVFVEDRLRTANQAAEANIRTYLVNRDWNIGRDTHSHVIRIINLIEFYRLEYDYKIEHKRRTLKNRR